jgi:hypothetical protein
LFRNLKVLEDKINEVLKIQKQQPKSNPLNTQSPFLPWPIVVIVLIVLCGGVVFAIYNYVLLGPTKMEKNTHSPVKGKRIKSKGHGTGTPRKSKVKSKPLGKLSRKSNKTPKP